VLDLERVNMRKFLLTVCVFGLLLSFASAREAIEVPGDRFSNFKKERVHIRIMVMRSGSMAPTAPEGGLVLVGFRMAADGRA
jgi:hypothetical protein